MLLRTKKPGHTAYPGEVSRSYEVQLFSTLSAPSTKITGTHIGMQPQIPNVTIPTIAGINPIKQSDTCSPGKFIHPYQFNEYGSFRIPKVCHKIFHQPIYVPGRVQRILIFSGNWAASTWQCVESIQRQQRVGATRKRSPAEARMSCACPVWAYGSRWFPSAQGYAHRAGSHP